MVKSCVGGVLMVWAMWGGSADGVVMCVCGGGADDVQVSSSSLRQTHRNGRDFHSKRPEFQSHKQAK